MPETLDDYLPHHIYMSLWSDLTRAEIAAVFSSSGWSSRKCSWTDYEVELTDKAALVIESENPVLVHGPLGSVSEMVPEIRKILDDFGIPYSFEAYDERDEIVTSVTKEEYKARGGPFRIGLTAIEQTPTHASLIRARSPSCPSLASLFR